MEKRLVTTTQHMEKRSITTTQHQHMEKRLNHSHSSLHLKWVCIKLNEVLARLVLQRASGLDAGALDPI